MTLRLLLIEKHTAEIPNQVFIARGRGRYFARITGEPELDVNLRS